MAAFDAAAASYDAAFTERRLGRWLRAAVQQQIAPLVTPGAAVLELGCGTGADAVWLAGRSARVTATDASAVMLALTQGRAAAAGVGALVETRQWDLAQPWPGGPARYDGVLSNFGPLNCLPDLRPLAADLARLVRPGGWAALVPMGPLCLWEIGWHLGRGRPRQALRRLRAGAPAQIGGGAQVRVWYPSPGRLRAALAPHFRQQALVGVGGLLPPSYLAGLVERWPRLFETLALLEPRLAARWPWPWLSDHYLALFERV